MHFPQHGHWKLVGLGAWARAGDPCGIELYEVRYAAPELLQADLHAVCFFIWSPKYFRIREKHVGRLASPCGLLASVLSAPDPPIRCHV